MSRKRKSEQPINEADTTTATIAVEPPIEAPAEPLPAEQPSTFVDGLGERNSRSVRPDPYRPECNRVRQNIVIAEAQLRDYGARLGKPFTLDAYQLELTALRDQLKAGLSGATHEPDNEDGPSIPELADRIKALKAANNIEAAPQRIRQKHSSAEEPIIARIRRRTDGVSASNPAIESDATSGEGSALPPEPPQNSSVEPQLKFRERIALKRQRGSDGPPGPD